MRITYSIVGKKNGVENNFELAIDVNDLKDYHTTLFSIIFDENASDEKLYEDNIFKRIELDRQEQDLFELCMINIKIFNKENNIEFTSKQLRTVANNGYIDDILTQYISSKTTKD